MYLYLLRKFFYTLILLVFVEQIHAQYCNGVVTGTINSCGITNVAFSNLNHPSLDMEGYMNYTAFSATVYRMSTYGLSVTNSAVLNQNLGVWIDWNQDLDFADAGEKVMGPQKFKGTTTWNITIPQTALSGSTRMRVVSDLMGNPIDSCTTSQIAGDIEDYTVIIRDTVIATATQPLSPEFINPAVEKKVLALEIYSTDNYTLSSVTFNTNGTTNLPAISNAKLFYSGTTFGYANSQFGAAVASPSGNFTINGSLVLQQGVNNFWLTYDVNGNVGDIVDAELVNIGINTTSYQALVGAPPEILTITPPICNYNSKQNNIWMFGEKAGLNFNGGAPVSINGSAMGQMEGVASIADNNGNLLFYTEGDTVWDKNHNVMLNGTGLGSGVTPSTTQGALIIPQPDNNKIFYVFAIEPQAQGGLYYSVVDMSLAGGLGAVTAKKIKLVNYVSERITACMHANKRDIWIVSHDAPGNTYYSFLLTPTDLKDPVTTSIGYSIINGVDAIGTTKISPDKTRLATTYAYTGGTSGSGGTLVELYDFNNATGIMSNLRSLTFAGTPYGVEFSPNSQLMYVGGVDDGFIGPTKSDDLWQYDVSLGSAALINASKIILSTGLKTGQLQLAPDGKIYVNTYYGYSIGTINNPNTIGAGCNYVSNTISLGANHCWLGLPFNFIQEPPPVVSVSTLADTICNGASVALSASGGLTYKWIPGTGLSSTNTASVVASPASTTTYTVIVSNSGSCPDSSTAIAIKVNPLPTLTISPASVCSGSAATLSVTGASTYVWSPGAGLSSITDSVVVCNVASTTNYTVTGTSSGGCVNTASTSVAVVAQPTVSVSLNDTVCNGQSATLTAGGGTNYLWSNSSTTSSILVTPTLTTVYTVSVSNGLCNAKDSVTIYTDVASAIISGSTSVCNGYSTTLSANSANTYLWSTGATTATISISPTVNTPYSLTVTGIYCSANTTATVSVVAPPVLNISGNTTICIGQTAILTAGGGGSYSWSTNSTTTSIVVSPTVNTVYSVSVSNGICPDVTGSVSVSVAPTPTITAVPDQTVCAAQTITLSASASGGINYTWSSGETTSAIVVSPVNTAIYTVTVSDGMCSDDHSVQVTVSVPLADAGSNTTISLGQSTTLNVTGGTSYLWAPGTTLSCTACASPVATPTVSTMYYVTVTNENGCTGLDSVYITVEEPCTDNIFVPNAFSPNNDGQNDVLKVEGLDCVTDLSLAIYNRWGQNVFEAHNAAQTWDGTFKGKDLDTGVYSYILRAVSAKGELINKTGNISLIR